MNTLSIQTKPSDLKGKGPDKSPIFESLGWTEYILPDGSCYYALHMSSPASPQHLKMPTPITVSPTVTVVADYDLREPAILKRVCEEMRTLIKSELPGSSVPQSTEGGWELWLHRPLDHELQTSDATCPSIAHTWINHARRLLSSRPLAADVPPGMDGDAVTLVDSVREDDNREKLVKELMYWSFVEKHPAHGILDPAARREATEGLTWSYAGKRLE